MLVVKSISAGHLIVAVEKFEGTWLSTDWATGVTTMGRVYKRVPSLAIEFASLCHGQEVVYQYSLMREPVAEKSGLRLFKAARDNGTKADIRWALERGS